jgi:hypothetical protein
MDDKDLMLLVGETGKEQYLKPYLESPTWIVDEVWDEVWKVGVNSLDAYLAYTKDLGLPHSYLLGLDILITAVAGPDGRTIEDIRPTILEGPCCNSYPACPNIFASRLYLNLKLMGKDPAELVEYPTDPLGILEKIVLTFQDIWEARTGARDPKVGIITRPYAESEEELAHELARAAFEKAGVEVYRVTPSELPKVQKGRLWAKGVPLDMVYRRIERIHVPQFYGIELGRKIIEETGDTVFINPWAIDDLRSKTKEEDCFRRWEKKTGVDISRPTTLVGDEISADSVRELAKGGGWALKRWDSTGGKGVFLHMVDKYVGALGKKLYERFDGRHMVLMSDDEFERQLKDFDHFSEDASIQQMRLIDARPIEVGKLVYDTRLNVLYNEKKKEWEFLSGVSRCVPCGKNVTNGNSLLTNISSGAEISPLIVGRSRSPEAREKMIFGPLLAGLLEGKTTIEI